VRAVSRIQVLLYTRQPFVARGFACVLHGRREFHLIAACDSLNRTAECLRNAAPDLVLIHLTSRLGLDELHGLRVAAGRSRLVLWGDGLVGEFAFQAMQLGVHGILPGDMTVDAVLAALQNVHRGVLCFEGDVMDAVLLQRRVSLTKRQGQVIALVAEGLKNKEIANRLGVTEGTVKVYLYKLFRKLGVNDRLDMALFGLKNFFAGAGNIAPSRPVSAVGIPAFGPRSLPLRPREPVKLHAVS